MVVSFRGSRALKEGEGCVMIGSRRIQQLAFSPEPHADCSVAVNLRGGGLRDEIRCFVSLNDTPIGAQRRFFRLVSFDCPSRESQYRIVVLISTAKKKWW